MTDNTEIGKGDEVEIEYTALRGGSGGGGGSRTTTTGEVIDALGDGTNVFVDEDNTDRELHVEGNGLMVERDGSGYRDDQIGEEVEVRRVEEYSVGYAAYGNARVTATSTEEAVEKLNEAMDNVDTGDLSGLSISFMSNEATGEDWSDSEARDLGIEK